MTLTLKQLENVALAISGLIDSLHKRYNMEFRVLSIGNDESVELLKKKIGHFTRSPLLFETFAHEKDEKFHIDENFRPQVIISLNADYKIRHFDFREDYSEHLSYFEKYENITQLNTYRKAVTIFYHLNDSNDDHINIMNRFKDYRFFRISYQAA